MPKTRPVLLAFNRGRISRLALSRVDINRVALSSEIQTNWMPRTLGSMMLRPGLGWVLQSLNDKKAKHIPFVKRTSITAVMEISAAALRPIVDEAPVTRGAVGSSLSNEDFDTDLASWSDTDEGAAASSWKTGGYLSLVGTGSDAAQRQQTVTVAVADRDKEHALRIEIARGPIELSVTPSGGGSDLIATTELKTGVHSLAFTPSGSFDVLLSNRNEREALVDHASIELAGEVILPAPWPEDDLSLLRWDQSEDVIFVACQGHRPRRIERRALGRSWSLVEYVPEDGPYRLQNTSKTTLTPGALSGDVTLVASKPVFRADHVGALFRVDSVGQKVEADVTADDQWSDPIRVTGVGTTRDVTVTRAGTWAGTVRLQRSLAEPGNWANVQDYTGNATETYNDGLDNEIAFYRIGMGSGDHTSGTAELSLLYSSGSITGVGLVTAVADELNASVSVLKNFGNTDPSTVWFEGAWSERRGYPTTGAIYEGRLWWLGLSKWWGSVSDAFESFDPDVEGDSGPIDRSIGSGPSDVVNWVLPLLQLVAGTEGAEQVARSNSFQEPLSPSNFNIKPASRQGSANVLAVPVDNHGIFVQRGGTRVYELQYNVDSFSYGSADRTQLVPEIGEPGIVTMAVQRQPDTRIHCVRSDGTVAVLIFDPTENVICWVDVETDGEVEDVVVLPGTIEDQVYYQVRRTVDAQSVRFLERWAREDECRGADICKLADSHIVYDGAATTEIPVPHLEGKTVVIWADGKDKGTQVVTSGKITLSEAASKVVVGLAYSAPFKSTKLAYAAGGGTALNQPKTISELGLVLADTHAQGLKFGPDFGNLDPMPIFEDGAEVDPDHIWEAYDEYMIEFPGDWDTDSRICLQAAAPRPVTVLSVGFEIETHG